jgi:E3 ubiquitin-protein ligase SIAH1
MLQCPVCFDLMEAPIYQCSSGHIICSGCCKQVNSCPQCRVAFNPQAPIRTLALEQMIEQMQFKYPCKNEGCKVRLSAGKNRADHHESCLHRRVSCFCTQCDEKMALSVLCDHFQSEHEEHCVAVDDDGTALVDYRLTMKVGILSSLGKIWCAL